MISCRVSVVLTLVVLACLVPGSLARKKGKRPAKRAENVTCPSGKHNYYVELEAGKNFTFELEDYYGDRSRCRVEYRVGSCSNVIVQSIGYNLKGKSCYTRTVGEGKSDESKAMKVRVCAEDVEKWPANDTDSSEDLSKIGMMQDSDSWDDVGINQDFVMAFNAPKGVANKGNSIMLNVHCEAGIEYDQTAAPDCQCGIMNKTLPVPTWEIESDADDDGNKYRGFLIAKEWALFSLPDGTDNVPSFEIGEDSYEARDNENHVQLSKNVWMINIADSEDISFDDVTPICLPSMWSLKKDDKKLRLATVGHQWDKETQSFDDVGTELKLRVMPNSVCNKKLKKNQREELGDGEGCAYPNKKSSPSVCQVDVGAPLYTKLGNNQENVALFGVIVELGEGSPCASKGEPARFQRLNEMVVDKIRKVAEAEDFTSCPSSPIMPNCFPAKDSGDLPSHCPEDTEICCDGECVEKKMYFECISGEYVCAGLKCQDKCYPSSFFKGKGWECDDDKPMCSPSNPKCQASRDTPEECCREGESCTSDYKCPA